MIRQPTIPPIPKIQIPQIRIPAFRFSIENGKLVCTVYKGGGFTGQLFKGVDEEMAIYTKRTTEAPKIKVIRRWDMEDIMNMCIKHNFYTRGDTRAYTKMLNYVNQKEPTPEKSTSWRSTFWITRMKTKIRASRTSCTSSKTKSYGRHTKSTEGAGHMASEKNIELMKKLMALAERGIGGEKETAKRKLAQLMDKYGVSDADLSDEALEDHEYKYRDQNEKKLLRQIFYKINHERDVLIYSQGRGMHSILIFRATKAEAIQAGIEYEFYRQLWKEEQDFLMECFIQKHRLFRLDPDAPTQDLDEETSKRMWQMMQAMEDKQLQRMIESKEETA